MRERLGVLLAIAILGVGGTVVGISLTSSPSSAHAVGAHVAKSAVYHVAKPGIHTPDPTYGTPGDIDINTDMVSPIDNEIQFPYISMPFYPNTIVLGGNYSGGVTVPPDTYAANGTLLTVVGCIASMTEASTTDEYDTASVVWVLNYQGTAVAKIKGMFGITEGNTSNYILTGGYSLTSLVGSDITYNSTTGVIKTTNGGVYSLLVEVVGYWHAL